MVSALSALRSGTIVLVDANIFIYAFTGRSEESRHLIERCKDEEVLGVTTAEVISDVCHRLMVIEAVEAGVIKRPSAADLREKQDAIPRLRRYWEMTLRIFGSNLLILPLDEARHRAAHQIRTDYGLLTNDSLIAATARQHAIASLASRDADFERIPGLTVYMPTDIP